MKIGDVSVLKKNLKNANISCDTLNIISFEIRITLADVKKEGFCSVSAVRYILFISQSGS